jgi:hypothetical protein
MNNHYTQLNPVPTKAQLAENWRITKLITLIHSGRKPYHTCKHVTQLGANVSLSELNEKTKERCTSPNSAN